MKPSIRSRALTSWLARVLHHAVVHPLYALPFGERWLALVDRLHAATEESDE